jgi:hypothetical protein
VFEGEENCSVTTRLPPPGDAGRESCGEDASGNPRGGKAADLKLTRLADEEVSEEAAAV